MSRLGLTNIYLKCGLPLIVFGVVCGVVVFNLKIEDMHTRSLLMWGATGGFMSGFVLYVIGRIQHALRRFGQARS